MKEPENGQAAPRKSGNANEPRLLLQPGTSVFKSDARVQHATTLRILESQKFLESLTESGWALLKRTVLRIVAVL